MKTKHTQGQWLFSKTAKSECTQFYTDVDKETMFVVTHNENGVSESYANDLLISAAPIGYELAYLVLLMRDDERFTKMPEWITIVEKAEEFAKATGEKEGVI